jgi:hypothetical protein
MFPGGKICCGSLRRRRFADFFDRGEPFQNALRFETGTEKSKINRVDLIGRVVVVLAIRSFLGLN